jgi:hypothetical protein
MSPFPKQPLIYNLEFAIIRILQPGVQGFGFYMGTSKSNGNYCVSKFGNKINRSWNLLSYEVKFHLFLIPSWPYV